MINVENITKTTRDGRQILKGISFQARKGDFIGILGPSGAGKTLTMRCLNGLTKPSTGKITIDINGEKHDIVKYKGKRMRLIHQKIGVVFQGFNLVKRLSVLENVMMGKLGQINQFRSLFLGLISVSDRHACLLLVCHWTNIVSLHEVWIMLCFINVLVYFFVKAERQEIIIYHLSLRPAMSHDFTARATKTPFQNYGWE